MVLDELQLLRRDIDWVALDHVRILGRGRPVDRCDELVGECAIIADFLERPDDLRPVEMAKSGGETIVVGHVEIEESPSGKTDRLVHILLLDIEVKRIEANPAFGTDRIGQRKGLGAAVEEVSLKTV